MIENKRTIKEYATGGKCYLGKQSRAGRIGNARVGVTHDSTGKIFPSRRHSSRGLKEVRV